MAKHGKTARRQEEGNKIPTMRRCSLPLYRVARHRANQPNGANPGAIVDDLPPSDADRRHSRRQPHVPTGRALVQLDALLSPRWIAPNFRRSMWRERGDGETTWALLRRLRCPPSTPINRSPAGALIFPGYTALSRDSAHQRVTVHGCHQLNISPHIHIHIHVHALVETQPRLLDGDTAPV
ncbi:hypothetical protein KC367_g244 [Hortaea werneckii]|nr:hypothetical protein KC367_g244 [Hortaea werneckii]